MATANEKPDNALYNLLFNIVVPVLVLNRLSARLGALPALVLALSSPLIYGGWDLWKKRKVNYLSILGLLNVGVTGGFAVMNLDGPWFWVKEAAFPLLIGIFVFASRWTPRPFIQTLLLNPQIFNLELINQKVKEHNKEEKLQHLIQSSTLLLSGSFLVSAILNFVLARRIFLAIDLNIQGEQRSLLLNEQIAEMTKLSFGVIFVPSLIILGGIVFYLLKKLKEATGLTLEELLPTK